MSTVEGKSSPTLLTRRSAPHLTVEPVVGELISLDDKPNDSNENESDMDSTDLKVSTGTPIDVDQSTLTLSFCGSYSQCLPRVSSIKWLGVYPPPLPRWDASPSPAIPSRTSHPASGFPAVFHYTADCCSAIRKQFNTTNAKQEISIFPLLEIEIVAR